MADTKELWKGLDLAELASSGYTNREIAELVGVSVNSARSAIRRRGLKSVVPRASTVRSRAEEMKPLDAVNYLFGVLEQWLPVLDGSTHEIDSWGIKFTNMQRIILSLLVDASPRVVSHDQIIDCVYSMRTEGEIPHEKIVCVFICQIRKVLPADKGKIVNEFGRGYRFVRAS